MVDVPRPDAPADEGRNHRLVDGEGWTEYERWEEDGLTFILLEGVTRQNRRALAFEILGSGRQTCFTVMYGRERGEVREMARKFARWVLKRGAGEADHG